MSGLSLRARLAGIPLHRLLLFLDYDGTLTPIVPFPDEARLPARVRALLHALAQSLPVVIVSGRELSDLRRMVGLAAVRYVGSHGLFYQEPGASAQCLGQPAARDEVREWLRAWTTAADGIRGALVEDKEWSVALHDRLVSPNDRRRLRRRALHAFAAVASSGNAALVRGKHVLEIRPAGIWNKGTAIAHLLQERWAAGRTPVYIGDDRTDFDAFVALRGLGLAVRVGGSRRLAGEDAWVSGPAAVESFLRWLLTSRRGVNAGLDTPTGAGLRRPGSLRPGASPGAGLT